MEKNTKSYCLRLAPKRPTKGRFFFCFPLLVKITKAPGADWRGARNFHLFPLLEEKISKTFFTKPLDKIPKVCYTIIVVKGREKQKPETQEEGTPR